MYTDNKNNLYHKKNKRKHYYLFFYLPSKALAQKKEAEFPLPRNIPIFFTTDHYISSLNHANALYNRYPVLYLPDDNLEHHYIQKYSLPSSKRPTDQFGQPNHSTQYY